MRALKVLVVAMGVVLVLGTVTLGVLLVQRAGGGASAGAARVDLALGEPEGTRIAGVAPVDGPGGGALLAVWVRRPDGTERVLLVDARRGRVAGEVRATDAAGAAPAAVSAAR